MATWTYADWIQQDDLPTRLQRLRLHITEVSQRVMGTSTRGNSVTAASERYLAGLREDEKLLTNTVTPRNFARNRVQIDNQ